MMKSVFQARPGDPDCTASGLIKAALSGDDMGGSVACLFESSRYHGDNLFCLKVRCRKYKVIIPLFIFFVLKEGRGF